MHTKPLLLDWEQNPEEGEGAENDDDEPRSLQDCGARSAPLQHHVHFPFPLRRGSEKGEELFRCKRKEGRRSSAPSIMREYSYDEVRVKVERTVSMAQYKRAVDVRHVLESCSHIFSSKCKPHTEEEADRLFDLSQPVDQIDQFVSHSWSASRMAKWIGLADFYNRWQALLLANATWLVITFSGLAVRLRTGDQVLPFSLAYLLCTATPLFVNLFALSTCQRLPGSCGSCVFVDKFCIHQWDDQKKFAAVRSLGHILEDSREMVILWSSDYFHRLWCIFEIATFSGLGKHHNFKFQPLWLSPLIYGLLMINAAAMAAAFGVQSTSLFPMILGSFGPLFGIGVFWALIFFLPALLMCYVSREGVLLRKDMEDCMEAFELDKCRVTVEADRAFVYATIQKLFGDNHTFEKHVRTRFFRQVQAGLGASWNIPYVWGLLAFQPFLWYSATDCLAISEANIHAQGAPDWASYALGNFLFYGIACLMLPLTIKAVGMCAYCTRSWPSLTAFPMLVAVFLLCISLIVDLAMGVCLGLTILLT